LKDKDDDDKFIGSENILNIGTVQYVTSLGPPVRRSIDHVRPFKQRPYPNRPNPELFTYTS